MIETIKEIGIIVGLPIVRSGCGWAVHALEDNKVTRIELKLLLATVVRVGSIGLIGYLGLNSAGLEVPALATAAGAYIADKLFSALKKK